jgi:hypothetical protein
MAEQRIGAVAITPLRILVVVALIFHAVGLFAVPYLGFLFSPDVRELMKYGGHGASINPTHPVLYAFYLIPYPALIAIYLGQLWGRYLLLAFYIIVAISSFYLGASVSGPPETFISIVASLADGAILGLVFFGSQARGAQPSNMAMVTDAPGADVLDPAAGSARRTPPR